jgi:hypothetical protein
MDSAHDCLGDLNDYLSGPFNSKFLLIYIQPLSETDCSIQISVHIQNFTLYPIIFTAMPYLRDPPHGIHIESLCFGLLVLVWMLIVVVGLASCIRILWDVGSMQEPTSPCSG